LIASNPEEKFWIWIGNGRNGKGVLRDLVLQTLGNYYDTIEIDYLTPQKVDAGRADPVMAKKKNCRMCISSEPEQGVSLRCGKIKQLTGRDEVEVRFLKENTFKFVPVFKLIVLTNYEPTIDGFDGGIGARVNLMTFMNKFVEKPDPKNKHEKLIDKSLKDRLGSLEYKLAFFDILLEHFQKYKSEGLILPTRFKADTEEYLRKNDPVSTFLMQNYDMTPYCKDRIKACDLHNDFVQYAGSDSISMIKFKSIMNNKRNTKQKIQ